MIQKFFNKVARKMSKTVMIAIIAMCVTNAANAQIRIAVFDFQAGAGVTQNDVIGISNILVTYLGIDTRFSIVERTQLQRVLREHGLQHSTNTAADAVRLGRILNVDKVIIGDINIVGGQYNVDCRVVSVQTGAVIATAGDSWAVNTVFRGVLQDIAQDLRSRIIAFNANDGLKHPIYCRQRDFSKAM